MSGTTFTPGPWHAYPNPMRDDGWFVSTVEMTDTNSQVVRDGAVAPYCVPLQNITFFQINQEANAQLIAAAPEMFEALESVEREINPRMLDRMQDDDLLHITLSVAEWRACCAALAKARGDDPEQATHEGGNA